MNDRHRPRIDDLRGAVLESDGATTREERAAAFAGADEKLAAGTYVPLVREQSYRITNRDIDALLESGLSEDAIFELTVAAALGAADERLHAGLEAMG
jgi:alkylhydroperoxidase family enzyme